MFCLKSCSAWLEQHVGENPHTPLEEPKRERERERETLKREYSTMFEPLYIRTCVCVQTKMSVSCLIKFGHYQLDALASFPSILACTLPIAAHFEL